MVRIRRRFSVAALALVLLAVAAGFNTATAADPVFQGSAVGFNSAANPLGCVKGYDRATWHRVSRKVFDGKWRATRHERRTLARVFRCQFDPKSKPILAKHRKRYARAHQHKLWTQGVGRFNRVYPAHGLYDLAGRAFIGFNDIRRIFEAAGASPREAYIFATIARGEGGGGRWGAFPGILGIDGHVIPGATSVGVGIVQNTPAVWCCVAWAYYTGLGGTSTNSAVLRNPLITAVMGLALYQFAGSSFSPWHGTRYMHDPGSNVSSSLTRADVRFVRLGGMGRLRER